MPNGREYPKLGQGTFKGIFEKPPKMWFRTKESEKLVIERLVTGFSEIEKKIVLDALATGDKSKIEDCALGFRTHLGSSDILSIPLKQFIPASSHTEGWGRLSFAIFYMVNAFTLWPLFYILCQSSMIVLGLDHTQLPRVAEITSVAIVTENTVNADPMREFLLFNISSTSLLFGISLIFPICSWYVAKTQLDNALQEWDSAATALKNGADSVANGLIVNFVWRSKNLMRWRRHFKLIGYIYPSIVFVILAVSISAAIDQQMIDADANLVPCVIASLGSLTWMLFADQVRKYFWWYYTTNTDPSTVLSYNLMKTIDRYSNSGRT